MPFSPVRLEPDHTLLEPFLRRPGIRVVEVLDAVPGREQPGALRVAVLPADDHAVLDAPLGIADRVPCVEGLAVEQRPPAVWARFGSGCEGDHRPGRAPRGAKLARHGDGT